MDNRDMPAFGEMKRSGELSVVDGGLTKREYAAIKVLSSMMTDPLKAFDCCPTGQVPSEYLADQSTHIVDKLFDKLEADE